MVVYPGGNGSDISLFPAETLLYTRALFCTATQVVKKHHYFDTPQYQVQPAIANMPGDASPAFFARFVYSQLFGKLPNPTMSFAGKTVIVTGSNVGLGMVICPPYPRCRFCHCMCTRFDSDFRFGSCPTHRQARSLQAYYSRSIYRERRGREKIRPTIHKLRLQCH